MPGVDGVEATRRIVKGYPKTAVLVLTMFDEDALVGALRAGARGYLLKRAEQAEIERAIRAVAAGDAIFSSEVAGGSWAPSRWIAKLQRWLRCRRGSARCSTSSPPVRRTRQSPIGSGFTKDCGQSHLGDLFKAGCCHQGRGSRDRQGRWIGPPLSTRTPGAVGRLSSPWRPECC